MSMLGLDAIIREINSMRTGVCPACQKELPPLSTRTRRAFTCDDICHAVWLNELVLRFGETQRITDGTTGKVYAVPTRVILEVGISTADLPKFAEIR